MLNLYFITYKSDKRHLTCEALNHRPGSQEVPFVLLPPAIRQLLPGDRGSVPRDKTRQTAALQLGKRDAEKGGEGWRLLEHAVV